jgi:hypothetical protein
VRAAALGDIDALEQLMAAGVDPGATDAPWGDTAAHAAALLDQSEALASVLDRRESPQTPFRSGFAGTEHVILEAARKERMEALEGT